MTGSRRIAAAVVAVATVAVAGCGLGPGESEEGTASLRVTRDHGAELIDEATLSDPTESETVVRFLDRETDIETSYGGNFVDSIDGISSAVEGGRSLDWYYYVNGYWSPIGAGEATVHANDRIWWDYRDWTDSYRVPAVVGSYPEPFRSGLNGTRVPTELVCYPSGTDGGACDEVEASLTDAGADLTTTTPAQAEDGKDTLRVLVGDWDEVRADRAAQMLEGGPGESGVFAEPVRCDGGWALQALSADKTVQGTGTDAGWIATVQLAEDQPTWLVSATDADALDAAAAMLDEETLRDHYAVASFGAEPVPLPAPDPIPDLQKVTC